MRLNVLKEVVDQSWTIARIAKETAPPSWKQTFENAEPELEHISNMIIQEENKGNRIFPLKRDIFNAFVYTPLSSVKVVIIGQDPYPQPICLNGEIVPRAVGLSFSVHLGDAVPKSLGNIYKELTNTVRGFTDPGHGDLRDWARQGVLLLNSCLTVREGQPGKHGELWYGFVNKVIKEISVVNPQCIYLLWGREAQKVKTMIGEKSIILEAAHPSGFSAHRGFFGCNHFNQVNELLVKQKKVAINWKIRSIAEINAKIPTIISEKNNSLVPIDVDGLARMPEPKVECAKPERDESMELPVIPNTNVVSSETHKEIKCETLPVISPIV